MQSINGQISWINSFIAKKMTVHFDQMIHYNVYYLS